VGRSIHTCCCHVLALQPGSAIRLGSYGMPTLDRKPSVPLAVDTLDRADSWATTPLRSIQMPRSVVCTSPPPVRTLSFAALTRSNSSQALRIASISSSDADMTNPGWSMVLQPSRRAVPANFSAAPLQRPFGHWCRQRSGHMFSFRDRQIDVLRNFRSPWNRMRKSPWCCVKVIWQRPAARCRPAQRTRRVG
jgi:hypothetical protein